MGRIGRAHRFLFVLDGCAVMSCGAAVWADDEKAYAAMSRLESDLFANYNKRVIPVEKLSDSVKVTMGMSAIYFKLVSHRSRRCRRGSRRRHSYRRTRPATR